MEEPVDGALCRAEIPDMPYTIFRSGRGGIGGGSAVRGEPSPPQPVNFMACGDIDAAIARITNHGGTIVTPRMEVGDAGRLARATDTEGNLLGPWQGRGGA